MEKKGRGYSRRTRHFGKSHLTVHVNPGEIEEVVLTPEGREPLYGIEGGQTRQENAGLLLFDLKFLDGRCRQEKAPEYYITGMVGAMRIIAAAAPNTLNGRDYSAIHNAVVDEVNRLCTDAAGDPLRLEYEILRIRRGFKSLADAEQMLSAQKTTGHFDSVDVIKFAEGHPSLLWADAEVAERVRDSLITTHELLSSMTADTLKLTASQFDHQTQHLAAV